MILRSANIGAALRYKQRGFLLNPARFGGGGGGGGTGEVESQFDAASKGTSVTLTGTPVKTAECWHSNGARTNQPRTTGRRCFGIKLNSVTSPEAFFAGMAKITGWDGTFGVDVQYLWYTGSTRLVYYPTGTNTVYAGMTNPTVANDTAYYDVNLDTGTMALKLNSGSWTSAIALVSFAAASWAICVMAPSTSTSAKIQYTILTTAAELGANIPAGAVPWDNP